MDDYDMTAAGFDGFMSRSIDSTPALNLDSPVPFNNALPFDRTQVTGSQGDTFNMGGIGMSAKDNAITLNDGQLIVNDTNTNNTIQASSGNITYNDSSGNTVIQEGVLPDDTTGIRALDTQQRPVAQLGRFQDKTTAFKILDTSGLGIAQFGQFPNGSVALKVAKSGHDVSTATDDNLIFNSNQDIFKIVGSGSAVIPASGTSTSTTSISHGLGYIPAYLGYVFFSLSSSYNLLPALSINDTTGAIISFYEGWTDATTINFRVHVPGGTVSSTTSVKYYLLQETAN